MSTIETVVLTLAAIFCGLVMLFCGAQCLTAEGPGLGAAIGFWGAMISFGIILGLFLLYDIRDELREANLRHAGDRGEEVELRPMLPPPVMTPEEFARWQPAPPRSESRVPPVRIDG